ncbi:LacI family DNA-binding transcriptional regulator [Glaciimonas immobilis]|uniref:LacI family DNA-binding transcriptional regulator n=1 Tax=Glaciimonas immobilis TaxID=728004 RepID=UPI001439731D|nr:LacI family DNA-binding transcriptional regulator [Glaciimonas immobilis]KAF3996730.1 LacI family DNA-binding transcriptional regulator [Glaciimonas immobilis]
MRPSIKQVALQAGVSIATVSRLMNQPDSVGIDTASKVYQAMKTLAFRPNFSGRNLRAGRSRTVGVVLPTFSNTVFAQCLQGLETVAREREYSVMVTATEYRQQDEAAAVELLLAHRVDGVILTVADAEASTTLDLLDHEKIPYVLVYNQPQQSVRPSVSVDNQLAAYDAVSKLIELGHRQIQMLAGHFHASDRALQRYHGYLQAMQQHGLEPLAPIEVARHTYTSLDFDYLQTFRDPSQRPSALFCSNDLLALSVMRDLRVLGLRVPDDVSVMGFDGIPLGELMDPMLSSVEQPSEQIGALALRTLVTAIEEQQEGHPTSVATHILPHTVRLGGSVKPFVQPFVKPFVQPVIQLFTTLP